MSLVHKELFYSEVQYKLVELNGLIEYQKKNEWPDPNLVTTQLGDVLNELDVATNSGKYSNWLSNDERTIMERLDNILRQHSHDELYKFSVLTQSDKNDFEDLQLKLQNVGFGMNMTISQDWKTFINKSEKLLALLENN
ncbi:hypothetical protein [Priestia megaterium]|uniref:hypothetical protein n=1 Tax=Priestia megaterium TaxID=1404 RepID=UPI001129BCB8|nr:hypothetical protein [Priestia megaterium]TPF18410.1 hypothetical protein CBE78_04070 [Priestia megaterium]TPF22520.1 hypothetical protein CBE79_06580 [Priestia megaterium]